MIIGGKNRSKMEILSTSDIISMFEKEVGIETLHLPSQDSIANTHSKDATEQSTKGALFQKVCATCQAPSKYQCPKCSVLSCSVKCVKAHKSENNCDGNREITAFVAVEEFNDATLRSDFHFLEDARRSIDIAHRTKKDYGLSQGLLPINLMKLQMAARLRKTDLHVLPPLFSKRKRSTTFFRYSDRKIFWRLEWEFPHVEFSCYDERVDEDTRLCDCVDKYVNENSEYSDPRLSYYHLLKPQEIAVLLLDENCPSNVTQYHLLEQNKTLKSNFKHKKIIEYPTLLVVSKLHLSCYQLSE